MTSPLEYGPVNSLDELAGVVAQIQSRFSSGLLLYRGQTSLHPTVRSGRARPNSEIHPEVERGWETLALSLLQGSGVETKTLHFPVPKTKAILQHYGLATYFVDLTENIEVAAWFATNKYSENEQFYMGSKLRKSLMAQYESLGDGRGYIIVLSIPDHTRHEDRGQLFNLNTLPSAFARPHRQHGWLMQDRPSFQPDPNDFWVATISIDRTVFTNSLTQLELFPGHEEDPCYAALCGLPFALTSIEYYADGSFKKFFPAIGSHLLHIPQYGTDLRRRKYNDKTIYEPRPIRLWSTQHYALSEHVEGFSGDIAESVKLVLTPEALARLLGSEVGYYEWLWPDAVDMFFFFAEYERDISGRREPPYRGIWLHRQGEFILEHQTESDEEATTVCSGHAYALRAGQIGRQELKNSCICDKPQSHDLLVQAMLRIPTLLREARLAIVPHPDGLEKSYYLLAV